MGHFEVQGPDWHWVRLGPDATRLPRGRVGIELSTSDAGIAADCLCITNDAAFRPRGRGREPDGELSVPGGLCLAEFTLDDADRFSLTGGQIKLTWEPARARQGVTRYQVYRGEGDEFPADPEHLVGSPAAPVFHDCDLLPGSKLFYRVRAMDAWGNLSAASPARGFTASAPPVSPVFEHHHQRLDAAHTVIAFDAGKSRCRDGAITQWQWDFGDGATGKGAQVTHAYAAPGRYTVVLRLGTDRGAGGKLQKTIQISPSWVERARTGSGVWLEAESFTGEGGGTSRMFSGRVNASGRIVTYWDKDIGHWLEWEIPVAVAGNYAIALRYASGARRALRDCRIDGSLPSEGFAGLTFAGTGGYCTQTDNWAWVLLKDRNGSVLCHDFSAGDHTLRLTNRGGGMALDAILLVPSQLLPESP